MERLVVLSEVDTIGGRIVQKVLSGAGQDSPFDDIELYAAPDRFEPAKK